MVWKITPSQPVPVDPFRSQVSLLLHGDGANGSTTITDSSPTPKTVTAVGDAKISTAQSKFGGSSIAFDGSGDYLTMPSNADFAFPDNVTIETWFRVSTTSVIQYIYSQPTQQASIGLSIYVSAGGRIGVQTGSQAYRETAAIALVNTWHFLAITKSNATYTTWLDGIQQSYVDSFGTMLANIPQQRLTIGAIVDGTSGFLNGHIDEFRITKGILRYTAGSGFTPPTAPFPDA